MKKNICIVIASRANYGRAKSIILELIKKNKYKVQIILAASAILDRFGDLRSILKKDKIKYHKEISIIIEGSKPSIMAKSTGLALIELTTAFEDLKPDYVVTIGDRYETMATAIAASYMNITLVHIQGGEITGSIDESVRHAITKLSHIHFVATKESKKNVIKLGEDKKYVFNVGCPSLDLVSQKNNIKSNILTSGVGPKIDISKKFFTVVFHPVTTEFQLTYNQTQEIINFIDRTKIPTLWLWPNVDSGSDGISKCIRKNREKRKLANVMFVKNLDVAIYNYVLSKTFCCIGNSSSFIREGSYLGTPCVLLGNRQNKREISNNIIKSSINSIEIRKKVKILTMKKIKKSNLYGNGQAGKKIANILYKLSPSIQKSLKL